ncbi:putative protein 33 [Rhizopogon vesiculosus]|uniref:DRBM domain-containing protein n=1 Tax=Rhizopogon vesiculosus TaxID=180088 RepID=A0A1J8QR91_9AGAM|nr:putative protein 33 [Rhizopogon vesiculosus]
MSNRKHPRTVLNNELQSIFGGAVDDHVKWVISSSGSPSSPIWRATIMIDDMKYGHAEALTKGAAQDEAARQAYDYLRREQMARRGY